MAAQPTSGINAKHGLYFGYTKWSLWAQTAHK